MPESDRDYSLREHQVSRVRAVTHKIADRLRRMAEDIDRIAEDEDLNRIPDDVATTIAWGMANADLGSPARQLRELSIHDEHIRKQEIAE